MNLSTGFLSHVYLIYTVSKKKSARCAGRFSSHVLRACRELGRSKGAQLPDFVHCAAFFICHLGGGIDKKYQ